MQLTFWGAARTVTGSMHLVELEGGPRLLLDCGLYQGHRAEAQRINSELPFDATTIDVVLLSHAHIDHSGLLPKLHQLGFRGRIFATSATADLCRAMLPDSAHIQEKDVEYVNRRHKRKGLPPVAPLYSMEDADAVLELFETVNYGESFSPVPGVDATYTDAGHILGSAAMVLSVTEGGTTRRLGFTGDVGRANRPILRDPQPMGDCDWVISESTYGGKVHEPQSESRARLEDIVRRTAARGGKVIIPAFAVGRTQEIVYVLDQLAAAGRLPPVPVFVDSPLAVNVTRVYRDHPECYDEELMDYLATHDDAFGFSRLTYVRDVEESKRLNRSRLPMVIISASGMCEAGRILHHLKNGIEDERNTVLMVGYCAEHTLGRRLIEHSPEVRIFGEPYRVRAEVEVMNSYSAHADEPELLTFLDHLDRERLRKVFLVHGDPPRQAALARALHRHGYPEVESPKRGHHVHLT